MTQPVRCLRHLGRTAERFPPSAGLVVAATIGLLWLGSAPALASGPEPAPAAPAPTPRRSTSSTPRSSTPAPPAPPTIQTRTYRATPVSSTKPAQSRAAHSSVAGAKPKVDPQRDPPEPKKADKTRSSQDGRAPDRVALGAPQPGSSGTNGLLFVGGLALIVLVLGDAAFLTLASRVLREPADRWR